MELNYLLTFFDEENFDINHYRFATYAEAFKFMLDQFLDYGGDEEEAPQDGDTYASILQDYTYVWSIVEINKI